MRAHVSGVSWRLVHLAVSHGVTLSVESLVAHASFSKIWIQCNSPRKCGFVGPMQSGSAKSVWGELARQRQGLFLRFFFGETSTCPGSGSGSTWSKASVASAGGQRVFLRLVSAAAMADRLQGCCWSCSGRDVAGTCKVARGGDEALPVLLADPQGHIVALAETTVGAQCSRPSRLVRGTGHIVNGHDLETHCTSALWASVICDVMEVELDKNGVAWRPSMGWVHTFLLKLGPSYRRAGGCLLKKSPLQM